MQTRRWIRPPANRVALCAALLLSAGYIFWNTGLHGDDFSLINQLRDKGLADYLTAGVENRGTTMFALGTYYFFWWAYYFVGDAVTWPYDVMKLLVSLLSIWLVCRFAEDYLPRDRALLAAALFLFNPAHDATTYVYPLSSYVLAGALVLYGHSLVRHERYLAGLATTTLGAFMVYSSPPFIFGLSFIFIAERNYRKAIAFLVPGMVYVLAYFAIASIQPVAEQRLDAALSLSSFARSYAIQLFSFPDAALGPSFVLKVWWSIAELSFVSLVIALGLMALAVVCVRSEGSRLPASLYIGLAAVLLFAFGMFALTGRYGQTAFNQGNRVMIYAALLVAFAAVSLRRKVLLPVVAVAFVLPALGLADHWKAWSETQVAVMRAIRMNPSLARVQASDMLLVSGHMYSRLGPFSHSEFLSMPWVTEALLAGRVSTPTIVPLAGYVRMEGGSLIDSKYGRTLKVSKPVYVYKSEEDRLVTMTPEELAEFLAIRPPEVRHWIQLTGDSPVRAVLLRLSPRLGYLFPDGK